jgi:signal transduction histidine kinase
MVLLIIILFLAAVALVVIFLSRRFSDDARKDTDKKLRSQKKLMTNNIAHELRTPVTSIRGYLETLVDNPSLPEEKRILFTQRAYLQALRLSDLIRDISLVTKIEDAPEMITKAHIGIRKITEEVFDELGAAIKEKKISVDNQIQEGVSIKGNYTLVYSIFRNLVENSIRYGGEGISIHLECKDSADGKLNFIYSDTGSGVPEEYLDKIFTRFYRLPQKEMLDTEGSGLGLSIVRNAVIFHGGSISAFLLKPHGLEFRFTLSRI